MRRVAATACIVLAVSTLQGSAQLPDPSKSPRVERADIVIVGGFRVPDEIVNGVGFDYGGLVMAWNPSGPSLFLSSSNSVAEITIPAPAMRSLSDLPRASFRRPFVDVLSAHRGGVGPAPADRLGGLLVHEGRLIGSAYVFYDADNSQERSHFAYSATLSPESFSGWSRVWQSKRSGFVAGPMAAIPPEWQDKLGGPALTGLCCVPIVSRTSFGPSAFAINPAQVGQPEVNAMPLLYYTGDHATLGQWSGSNPTYGATTSIAGLVIVPGTRSLLYFGSNGTGPYCYGPSTNEPGKAGTTETQGGEPYCYDPLYPHKGQHAYPYNTQVWAYDLNDLAAVKAGRKRPWEVVPYGVWPLPMPLTPDAVGLSSVAIDSAGDIYVAQYKGEPTDGGGGRPIIWTIRVRR
jgi:hypothetical protein